MEYKIYSTSVSLIITLKLRGSCRRLPRMFHSLKITFLENFINCQSFFLEAVIKKMIVGLAQNEIISYKMSDFIDVSNGCLRSDRKVVRSKFE